MAEVKHFKEDSVPVTTQANAIYFVKNVDVYDEYLTTKENVLLPVGNTSMINTLITAAIAGSGSDTYIGIAGEALGGGRLVYLSGGQLFLYDANNAALVDKAFGITKTAAALGASVGVQISGIFTEAGLGLTAGARYYAGLNGLLTLTPIYTTTTIVGIAVTTNSIKIEIQPSIVTI